MVLRRRRERPVEGSVVTPIEGSEAAVSHRVTIMPKPDFQPAGYTSTIPRRPGRERNSECPMRSRPRRATSVPSAQATAVYSPSPDVAGR